MEYKRQLPNGYENVRYKDHFELRYLRWDYFCKTENPNEDLLRSKENIIKAISRKAYMKYMYETKFQGMDIDDIENIARVYTVSFLGLYSFNKRDDLKQKFIESFTKRNGKPPTEAQIEFKDNSSLKSFLNQRLTDCALVFRRKSTSQAGFSNYSIFFRKHGEIWPTDDELLDSPRSFGWEPLSWAKFTKIKHDLEPIVAGKICNIDGIPYRIVYANSSFEYSDIANASDEDVDSLQHSYYNILPEEMELNEKIAHLTDLYHTRGNGKKIRILNLFAKWLQRRNADGKFKKEIAKIKKMIYDMTSEQVGI